MNLGNALKTLREARGMTRIELAKLMSKGGVYAASDVAYFEERKEWSVKGLEEDFAAALHIPVSLFLLFAADDEELVPNTALTAKIRQLALDLMRPEEG